MNINRAQEIIQSADRIEVEHEGRNVWINSVDEQSKTARVHPEGNPEALQTVSVEELKEVH